jgi:Fe-S-cluster-containing hydrogenase component 2
MKRNIVFIDEEKCNGCGLCIPNCAEGAIKIINGKAKLVDDRFCDGLGVNMEVPCCFGLQSIVEEAVKKKHINNIKDNYILMDRI